MGGIDLTKSRLTLFALVLVSALVAAACGGGDPASEGAETGCAAAGDDEVSVAIAFDVGGEGDQSFNDATVRGVENAVSDGLIDENHVTKIDTNATGSNRDDNVINASEQGCDLVIAAGFAF